MIFICVFVAHKFVVIQSNTGYSKVRNDYLRFPFFNSHIAEVQSIAVSCVNIDFALYVIGYFFNDFSCSFPHVGFDFGVLIDLAGIASIFGFVCQKDFRKLFM